MEAFFVLTEGGLVVWKKLNQKLVGDPVGDLVSEAVIESRAGEYRNGTYAMEWKKDASKSLLFIAIARQVLNLKYLASLVDKVHKKFVAGYAGELDGYSSFEAEFDSVVSRVEKEKPKKTMRSFKEAAATKKGAELMRKEEGEPEEAEAQQSELLRKSPSRKLVPRGKKGKKARQKMKKKIKSAAAESSARKPKPHWNQRAAKSNAKALDMTGQEGARSRVEASDELRAEMYGSGTFEEEEDESSSEEETEVKRGFFGNLVRGLTGRNLDEADLEPVINGLRQHIISKNVASEMAEQLSDAVGKQLLGKHLPSLSSVASHAKSSMETALVRILTPKRQVDILREIAVAKEKGRVYSIVFIGINGVGKSTNLSKVCAWLQSNGLKVMIAACDTFRSGAVEQLQVHADCLRVPLFQQGYGNDAASIAQAAVRDAGSKGIDVVLIDTAGRMQDNEPLMKALGKLVSVNRPDLVLFVGEALVGNDAVSQLMGFNQALIDYGDDKPRTVDGIILTKFDTIDDKVGAAISLAYCSGLPIVFLGTGQHYTDLKRMNPRSVAKSLLL